MRIQSSSRTSPLRMRVESTRASVAMNRWAISPRDISRLKTTTGMRALTPRCRAIPSASDVLPIAGRAARMIRLDFWKPEVILSRSRRPDEAPVSPRCSAAAEMRSTSSPSKPPIGTMSLVVRDCATSKMADSARSRMSRTSPCRPYPSSAISRPAAATRRSSARSRTICAWLLTLAATVTLDDRPKMKPRPPT